MTYNSYLQRQPFKVELTHAIDDSIEVEEQILRFSFGYYPNGGYRLKVTRMSINSKLQKVDVVAEVHAPAPGQICTMALAPARAYLKMDLPVGYAVEWHVTDSTGRDMSER